MISKIFKLLEKPWLCFVYACLIMFLCFMPSENIPGTVDDKAAHLLAFSGQGFLLYFWIKKVLNTTVLVSTFGIFIEIIQGILPEDFHRGFEMKDFYYDVLGGSLGIVVALFFIQRIAGKLN